MDQDDVVSNLDWKSLFVALFVVISAIFIGLYCSYAFKSKKLRRVCNAVCLRYWRAGFLYESLSLVSCSFGFVTAWQLRRTRLDHIFCNRNKYRGCRQQDLVKALDILCCSLSALCGGIVGCKSYRKYAKLEAVRKSVSS